MKKNMREAIKVYIARVDRTPSMGTTIKLYEGIEKSSFHSRRDRLLTYLKGTQEKKASLKKNIPDEYAYFEMIWLLRKSHLVESILPTKYAFILKCCGLSSCIHPACSNGEPADVQWYPEGPLFGEVLPTPVIAPGSAKCTQCSKKDCAGHYQTSVPHPKDTPAPVPSEVITEEVNVNPHFDSNRIKKIARDCILPPSTVQFYVNHLLQVQANRKRGAEKAKKTKQAKKAKQT